MPGSAGLLIFQHVFLYIDISKKKKKKSPTYRDTFQVKPSNYIFFFLKKGEMLSIKLHFLLKITPDGSGIVLGKLAYPRTTSAGNKYRVHFMNRFP